MQGNSTFLDPPEVGSVQAGSNRAAERKTMTFSFDKSYWSAGDRSDPAYASQETLYEDLGKELLDHGFAGFNACIVACEYRVRIARVGTDGLPMTLHRWTNWYADSSVCCVKWLMNRLTLKGSGKSYRCDVFLSPACA